MKLLTFEQVLELHALAIAATGGSEGLRDLGRLEAAVATQKQEVFGQELYPTIFEKAAAMICGIIADHAFVDGNKRTGMLVGLTLLDVNGRNFQAQPSELEDFAVRIAVEHLEIPATAEWLEARCHTL